MSSDEPAGPGEEVVEQRVRGRSGTFKRVKIVVGTAQSPSIIDAFVVDESVDGFRVRTAVMISLPDWVTLRFPDGATFRANRRWAKGLEIGFQIVPEDSRTLLDAMIAGLTPDQRRALIARIEGSLKQA